MPTTESPDREKKLDEWIEREAAARVLYIVGLIWDWYKPAMARGGIAWDTYGQDLHPGNLWNELFPSADDEDPEEGPIYEAFDRADALAASFLACFLANSDVAMIQVSELANKAAGLSKRDGGSDG